MGKKIVVVNAGPRKGWNTDILLSEASDGAVSAGAKVQRFDLFRLERYSKRKVISKRLLLCRKQIMLFGCMRR